MKVQERDEGRGCPQDQTGKEGAAALIEEMKGEGIKKAKPQNDTERGGE